MKENTAGAADVARRGDADAGGSGAAGAASSPARRGRAAAAITVACLLGAAGIWWFGVQSADARGGRLRAELKAVQTEIASMRALIGERPAIEARRSAAAAGGAARAESLLEPLLGSWAMRAKTLLEPVAEACGLEGVRFADEPETIALPSFGNGAAAFRRRRVRVAAEGPYQRLISFLCNAERRCGGMLTESVSVTGGGTPEVQSASFVFEWLSRPDEKGGGQ